jgi:hypothetical protein
MFSHNLGGRQRRGLSGLLKAFTSVDGAGVFLFYFLSATFAVQKREMLEIAPLKIKSMLDHDPNFLVCTPLLLRAEILTHYFSLKTLARQRVQSEDSLISGHIRRLIELHC